MLHPELKHQLRALLRAFWGGEGRTRTILLALAIAAVICAIAVGQVRLNAWNEPFYDAIQQKDIPEFLHQLLVFGLIVSVLLVFNVAQGWLHQTIKLTLRAWMTRNLISKWLQQKRAFQLRQMGEIGANPDQRIHQDAQHLTDLCTDLGVGLFQSSLLLASFVGVLWVLSSGIVFVVDGHTITVPGYMVWCALLYATAGSWLSWRVGRPLIAFNATHYAREAEFRAALVRTQEQADGIALLGYEKEQTEHLFADFAAVLLIMRRIIGANARLNWVTAGYGWLALVVPIVVASPGYFSGTLTFGELMMVVGAFYQVQQALRWIVDNAGTIADWRATLVRVMSFHDALTALDTVAQPGLRIQLAAEPTRCLRFQDVAIVTPAGPARLAEGDIKIQPGERVLIAGAPGTGKTALFQAIAGLPARGHGRIVVPTAARMAFLSSRPYVPPGRLRDTLSSWAGGQTDVSHAAALARVGLGHLSSALDLVDRWDRELSASEQHRLACARLLLGRPEWVISDGAIELVGEEYFETILSIFGEELAATAVVGFAVRAWPNGLYTRIFHLVRPELSSEPFPLRPASGHSGLLAELGS